MLSYQALNNTEAGVDLSLIQTSFLLLCKSCYCNANEFLFTLEIVFTTAAPAFDNLFMGCVFNINTVHKAVEKLTIQAFY